MKKQGSVSKSRRELPLERTTIRELRHELATAAGGLLPRRPMESNTDADCVPDGR